MNIVSYFNPDTLERDNDGQLGLYTDETVTMGLQFFPIDSQEFDTWVNGYHGIKSFALHIDNGTATFSKEFRKSGDRIKPYWYAAKRVNGKLKKLYFGTDFTKDKLNQIVDKLQEAKVTQEVTQLFDGFKVGDRVVYANPALPYEKQRGVGEIVEITDQNWFIIWQDEPKMKAPFSRLYSKPNELVLAAGHSKSARHIQPSLMELANDPVKLLNHKNKELERQNKDLNKRLIDALERVDALTQERNIALSDLKKLDRNYDNLQERCAGLQMTIDSLEAGLRKHQRDYQELNERHLGVKELHGEALTYIYKLESDIEKLQEYNRIGEQEAFDDLNTFYEVMPIIKKYRDMTIDKTKKSNPRYAYLIDFLADIDKLG
jgi:hypothetical protein